MHFFCAALIKEFRGLPHLCSPDDGIINQQKALILNKVMHRYQLHFRDQIPFALYRRRKRPGPGRRILNKGTGKRDTRLIGISDGMRRAGIRHPGHNIRLYIVPLRQQGTAPVTHFLHADALIRRRRIAIIYP